MTNESANNPIDQNTTCSTAALSQFASSTEAFTTITRDDFKKNPLAGQMMARLYADKTNELNEANEKILELTKQVSFYRSFPIANIGFALMNVIGTIVVGLGVSLDMISPGISAITKAWSKSCTTPSTGSSVVKG